MKSTQDIRPIKGHYKLSLREKFFFFISGIIISVPFTFFFSKSADYLCIIMPLLYASICSTAVFTPLIEEFAKAYPLFYRHCETERSLFMVGFFVGLGFGFSEFLVYILLLGAPLLLRLPAILFHAASTSIVAYGIARRNPVPFYLLAVFLHFLNNFSAFFGLLWFIGGGLSLVLTYYISWRLYNRTTEEIME